jgi:hypothetical protein
MTVRAAVTATRPSGAVWEADLTVGGAAFTCRLPSRPEGTSVTVTLLDPPFFAPDGEAKALPGRVIQH